MAVCTRPDGKEIAVASLDGQLTFWQPEISLQVGSVEGRADLGGGRRATDKVTAKTLSFGK